jgi:hypothetical protein
MIREYRWRSFRDTPANSPLPPEKGLPHFHGPRWRSDRSNYTRTLKIKADSLFPALHRLEQQGWITGEWTSSADGRRVKSYVLTVPGRRRPSAEKASVVTAMN